MAIDCVGSISQSQCAYGRLCPGRARNVFHEKGRKERRDVPYAAPSWPVINPVPINPINATAAYRGDLLVAFMSATATSTVFLYYISQYISARAR
jgi:hypothetical protein